MATKIFKGKSKEVADLLIQLCEKYYEGSSLERTSSSVTIESNLENDFMDPINFTCFGYEGIMDRLYASETGEFLIEVTAPLSDWYIDRYFEDEEEDQAYSDFNDYGGDYMSFRTQ